MPTRVDEIAERVYRLSTFVPSAGGPAGSTFNQFLIDADELHGPAFCGPPGPVLQALASYDDNQRRRAIAG